MMRASTLAALAVILAAPAAQAGAPDWLKLAARAPLPDYSDDTAAIVLFDERETRVSSDGEIRVVVRRAYKILRSGGRERGLVSVDYDAETQLQFLKAWSLPAGESDYEIKEKDWVESVPYNEVLFSDKKRKWVQIPAAEPGNVVGYEYEQKRRPRLLQDSFWFADTIPVRRARYVLELPEGWTFETYWLNHDEPTARQLGGNRWVWELSDIAAVEQEPAMPPWQAVAGRLELSFYPSRSDLQGRSHATWSDVAAWYGGLASGRRASSPEIRAKVAELTDGLTTMEEKIAALAQFAQRGIRYVAIEVGIGGYQPHAAQEVFSHRYGDCKDKATLLATMLNEIGVDSHHVLVHTRRGVVAREAPTIYSFNHVILAIELPAEVDARGQYAASTHDRLGTLLFFDPTDESTPLGWLPSGLQANRGLLITDDGGELVELPLQSPSTNRLLRVAKLTLGSGGGLSGEVQEIRWGWPGIELRSELQAATAGERLKNLERFLARSLSDFTLTRAAIANLDVADDNLVLQYGFVAPHYAKTVGSLLLVRPRVLGIKGMGLLEEKERKYPVEFNGTSLQSDIYEIELPSGYAVDEMPQPVEAVNDFAEYRSEMTVEGRLLRYKRTYIIKQVLVPVERLGELKDFYRRVAADERSQAVLKRAE